MKYKLIKYKRPVPWNRDEGAALVLVALMLVILMGFAALVVDMGRLSVTKRKLVAAADAAALAGAQEFANYIFNGSDPSTAAVYARNAAIDYAGKNGLSESEITVIVYPEARKVSVDVNREIYLSFAPVLGATRGGRAAHAAAITGPVAGGTGLSPVFIGDPAAIPKFGDQFILKHGAPSPEYGFGSFGCLDLSEDGKNKKGDYETHLKWGYSGTIRVGDYIPVLDGDNIGQTRDAIEEDHKDNDARFQRCCSDCTPENYEPGCPRVVIVPICDTSEIDPSNKDKDAPKGEKGSDDKKRVKVLGFATFFIVSYSQAAENAEGTAAAEEKGNDKDKNKGGGGGGGGGGAGEGQDSIQAVYLYAITEGEVGGDDTADYGTWAINLVE